MKCAAMRAQKEPFWKNLPKGMGSALSPEGLLGLARLLLLGGLASIGGFVVHVADRPPGTPDETEDAEEVESERASRRGRG